jgi:hypothetical protein
VQSAPLSFGHGLALAVPACAAIRSAPIAETMIEVAFSSGEVPLLVRYLGVYLAL